MMAFYVFVYSYHGHATIFHPENKYAQNASSKLSLQSIFYWCIHILFGR
jgi:hypothetical protein